MTVVSELSTLNFNADFGFLEALVRGMKDSLLKEKDYEVLTQCEKLEDLKLHLQDSDFRGFLADEAGPLTVNLIEEKLRENIVQEFRYIQNQAYNPLSVFLDYMTHAYMIDNIILVITGNLHERPLPELLPKCHPLGQFDGLETSQIAKTSADLHHAVLVDTPLAPYFVNCISKHDMDELNIEIIRNSLYRKYLEKFYEVCKQLGGKTAEIMCNLLEFEADRRAFLITINSFGTELSKEDRISLYPRCGKLNPYGLGELGKADDYEQVRAVANKFADYKNLFEESGDTEKTLEDRFFEYEVKLHLDSFMEPFHFGLFYSYFKLKEQESRNIVWISECISQNHRAKIDAYIAME